VPNICMYVIPEWIEYCPACGAAVDVASILHEAMQRRQPPKLLVLDPWKGHCYAFCSQRCAFPVAVQEMMQDTSIPREHVANFMIEYVAHVPWGSDPRNIAVCYDFLVQLLSLPSVSDSAMSAMLQAADAIKAHIEDSLREELGKRVVEAIQRLDTARVLGAIGLPYLLTHSTSRCGYFQEIVKACLPSMLTTVKTPHPVKSWDVIQLFLFLEEFTYDFDVERVTVQDLFPLVEATRDVLVDNETRCATRQCLIKSGIMFAGNVCMAAKTDSHVVLCIRSLFAKVVADLLSSIDRGEVFDESIGRAIFWLMNKSFDSLDCVQEQRLPVCPPLLVMLLLSRVEDCGCGSVISSTHPRHALCEDTSHESGSGEICEQETAEPHVHPALTFSPLKTDN
jgi:hypothetical protein